MSVRATIVVPTFDHGATLRYCIPSILRQTVQDIEIFLVGDGMPPAAAAVAREVAASDPRIKLFEFEKGPRHGEIYRHQLLQKAHGEIVCYLADDDLYLPSHVERCLELLRHADLAHTLPSHVLPDASVAAWTCDLSLPYFRKLILAGTNRVPLGCIAHTMEAYRALPRGWRTTPAGIATDHYMLQQFLQQPKLRAVSGTAPTIIHFASTLRKDWSEAQRLEELAAWARKLEEPGFPAELLSGLLAWFSRNAATDEAHYVTLETLLREQLKQTSDYAAGLETVVRGAAAPARS